MEYVISNNFLVAPSKSEILIAAFDNEDLINDCYNFWTNVYGFKMETMQKDTLKEALVCVLDNESLISNNVSIKV